VTHVVRVGSPRALEEVEPDHEDETTYHAIPTAIRMRRKAAITFDRDGRRESMRVLCATSASCSATSFASCSDGQRTFECLLA